VLYVGDIVRLNALHRRDDEAIVFDGRAVTYGELNQRVNRTAQALAASGIGRGDRVAALGRNSLEYVELYFATAKLGAMLVPLSFWHRTNELRWAVTDSDPSLVFAEPELFDPLAPVVGEIETVMLPSQDGDASEWAAFQARARSDAEPDVALTPEDIHMILYTSGTTGRPKGAMLSHGRTMLDAYAMALALRLRPTDTFMNYFPSFHVGNWDHMKLYLLVGARVVLLRDFNADIAMELIPRHRVTVMLGVPVMFHGILNHPLFQSTDTSSIRTIYYGAYDPSGIMNQTAEAFGARDGRAEMFHTYGLTEGGPFVTICPPEDLFAHWGSVGRAMPGVQIGLLDEDMLPVSAGTAGEICVRGPRMSGYWRNEEASAAALAGGWLHTGDVAIADDGGFLTIVDRKKDMIRTGGHNVYSKEIEDCLAGHAQVADVAVIGLADPVYEEQVCAVVVSRGEASQALAEELKRYVRSELAGYNTPKVVQFVDALPKNAVGKTQKHILRERFGSMFDSPVAQA
jgi:fatty-acyl-CoA synthase